MTTKLISLRWTHLFQNAFCLFGVHFLMLLFVSAADAGIQLAWDDNSDNEDGFVLERRIYAGPDSNWEVIDDLIAPNSLSYTDSSAIPGNHYEYRIKAFNSAGSSDYSNLANGIAEDSFASWTGSVFSVADQSDPEIIGYDKDPDGDGLYNLAEYALNSNPMAQDAPQVIQIHVDNNYAGIQFPRVSYARDISYVVMKSTDLVNWSEIARSDDGAEFVGSATIQEEGTGIKAATVLNNENLMDTTTQFFHLKIEKY